MTISGDNTNRKIAFEFNDLELTTGSIEKLMGPSEDDDKEFLYDVIRNVLKEASEIVDIRVEYHVLSNICIIEHEKAISIDNIKFNVGNIIFSQLKKSESFIFFLCTAGPLIGERSSAALRDKDPLKGYVLDIAGTEIVERAADLMQDFLSKAMLVSGLKITNRYSPGYCGWDVAEQLKLFSFFEENFCGVKLTPSALMQPVKSVSGIIGAGVNVKRASYKCRLCDMRNCINRRQED
ncbi:MAG TPA: vitamin B12 dependent-methionine synthase activation domain-containing protein [Bacteroidales bacterium]|nr:vitamin B12 dependent-methionine synthase activation domain-containing protein [Bacteroidales bacterium]